MSDPIGVRPTACFRKGDFVAGNPSNMLLTKIVAALTRLSSQSISTIQEHISQRIILERTRSRALGRPSLGVERMKDVFLREGVKGIVACSIGDDILGIMGRFQGIS